MQCEMCGKDSELFLTDIEGSQLKLCKNCGGYGKIIKRIKTEEQIKQEEKVERKKVKRIIETKEEIIPVITEDYANKVKAAREKLGLSQEDFAKKINEKISTIHNVETSRIEPGIHLSKKLEKALNIILIEEYKEAHDSDRSSKDDALTIGDMIKI